MDIDQRLDRLTERCDALARMVDSFLAWRRVHMKRRGRFPAAVALGSRRPPEPLSKRLAPLMEKLTGSGRAMLPPEELGRRLIEIERKRGPRQIWISINA